MEIELIIFVYAFLGIFYSIGFSNDKRILFAVWLVWPIVAMFVLGYIHANQFQAILNRDKEVERINQQNKLHSEKRATKW